MCFPLPIRSAITPRPHLKSEMFGRNIWLRRFRRPAEPITKVEKAIEMATKKPRVTSRRASPQKNTSQNAEVELGREICGLLDAAEQREWLVTNGIGGFASGTVSGNLTRRYHGLLVAALHPPVSRMQLVAKLDEIAGYDGADYALGTNRWSSGAIEPQGNVHIESFRLEGATPVWHFAIGDALLEKRVWMRHGENTTYVQYTMLRGSQSVELQLRNLINCRDFHSV